MVLNPQPAYLIVGASGMIGAAVVRQLAQTGRRLGLHYNYNLGTVSQLKEQLNQQGIESQCFQASFNSEQDCISLVQNFIAEYGVITGLAICNGEVAWKHWTELNELDWQKTFLQHCILPVTLAKRAIEAMTCNASGRIVYLSSISPKYGGSAKSLHYAAAKSALETAMLGMAKATAELGIRINGVRSGFVLSPQQTSGRSEQEISERVKKIPVKRAGRPEEIASAFGYLMSPDVDFITGEIVTVAGGD